MIQGIQGGGGLSPEQKKQLNEEYNQAAQGFKEALDKYSQEELPEQKQATKDVMSQYVHVMQHVAADLQRQKLLNQSNELEADLKALGGSTDAINKLNADLDKAKSGE